MSLCRSQQKENELPPFVGTVPFLCACIAPIPVRGLWEFLHTLIIILIQFKLYLFIHLFPKPLWKQGLYSGSFWQFRGHLPSEMGGCCPSVYCILVIHGVEVSAVYVVKFLVFHTSGGIYLRPAGFLF